MPTYKVDFTWYIEADSEEEAEEILKEVFSNIKAEAVIEDYYKIYSKNHYT